MITTTLMPLIAALACGTPSATTTTTPAATTTTPAATTTTPAATTTSPAATTTTTAATTTTTAATTTTPPAILVMPLRPAQASDAALAQLVSSSLVAGVRKAHDAKGKVVGADEVKAMLDARAQQALLGCDDDKCAGDVGKAVAADLVVSGTAGTIGGDVFAYTSLLNLKDGTVIARASTSWPATAQAKSDEAMAVVAKRLVDPDQRRSGDELMKEQFAALIIDETGTTNVWISNCAAELMTNGGARLVKPDVAKRARERMGANGVDGVTARPALDVLSEADVLSLLYGRAVYTDAGKIGETINRRASLTLQLVAVGTGDIQVSITGAGNGRGYSVDAADQQAAASACLDLKAKLPQALEARVARGTRATVEVSQATTPAAAMLALTELQKVPFVRNVRIMSTTAKGSSLDVTLKGRDGIALGLAVNGNAALGDVVAANETAVRIGPAAAKRKDGKATAKDTTKGGAR